ncbi:MAG: NAD-dependent DNA ligase LigA [Clostridium sp.]|nr:NAD-dependent DNA ligase LigA [Clostridium sp.]
MSRSLERIKELTERLNKYRHEYYNLSAPTVSDAAYDRLFDELAALERETGIVMANSPTQTVGCTAVSSLEKTRHPIPLLSLEKTKSADDLMKFGSGRELLLMLKLDGLTVKLTYENGELQEAATRGDGDEGEVITHNARTFRGVPLRIPYQGRLIVTGEAFIHKKDFEALKEKLLDSTGKPYRNARNLASGSVRLLDGAACKERRISFLPFNVLEGFDEMPAAQNSKNEKLYQLHRLGFSLCSSYLTLGAYTKGGISAMMEQLQREAEEQDIPIDGIVVTFNDIAYSKSCGRTGHHYKDGMAFKFADDHYETVLRSIEWTPSRTGEIAPVAVFDTVEIDGCEVSRASLHNLSFIKGLELMPGCRILVSKRNMIIPQVEDNLDRGGFDAGSLFPKVCPCCGELTRVHTSRTDKRTTETLCCDNPYCETRRLRQFVHFVSKKAMDIEGLSEATLEKFIGRGWLHSFMDIYRLDEHREEIIRMDGFGEKSWQRLWDAIQASRNTTFERYLIAMDIPMIGNTASRELCRVFDGSLARFEAAVDGGYDFTQLADFGDTLHQNIHNWFRDEENRYLWEELQMMMNIEKKDMMTAIAQDSPFAGKTIVVTGKVEPYTRDGINAKIASLGAHPGSSVSKNTDYLICGEKAGSKLQKAQALGVTVLSPAQFFQMAGE